MSKSALVIIAALCIILVPFLGFPRSWEPALFLFLGGTIIVAEVYVVLVRAQDIFFREYEITTDVYAEKIQEKVAPRRHRSAMNIEGKTVGDSGTHTAYQESPEKEE